MYHPSRIVAILWQWAAAAIVVMVAVVGCPLPMMPGVADGVAVAAVFSLVMREEMPKTKVQTASLLLLGWQLGRMSVLTV